MIKKVERFEAPDGELFKTREEAEEYTLQSEVINELTKWFWSQSLMDKETPEIINRIARYRGKVGAILEGRRDTD